MKKPLALAVCAPLCLISLAAQSEPGTSTKRVTLASRDVSDNTDALKLSVELLRPTDKDRVRLRVTFENAGETDITLNLGTMLANGRVQLPNAIRLILTKDGGKPKELHFTDRKRAGVAGRLDDYPVPLRAGSTYSVALSLRDYWCPATNEFTLQLEDGRYKILAEFTGIGPQHLNSGVEGLKHMPFWKGRVQSNQRQFGIVSPDE